MLLGSIVLIRQDECPPIRSTISNINVADNIAIKPQKVIDSKAQNSSVILSSTDEYARQTASKLSIELDIPCEFHNALTPINQNLHDITQNTHTSTK